MTIGKLLRQYRIERGKTQEEWSNGVVSKSYYSRVENGVHRISAEDLLALLEANKVSPVAFFNKLGRQLIDKYQERDQKYIELENLIYNAYYRNSKNELLQLKNIVTESNTSNKQDLLLLIEACIAFLKDGLDNLDDKTKVEIKKKIFDVDNWDKNKLAIYCNYMMVYDVNSNLVITRKILKQFRNTTDVKIQTALLAITSNLLNQCIQTRSYDGTKFVMAESEKIPTRPELIFYKNVLLLYKNMIDYHYEKREVYLKNCRLAINFFSVLGMSEFGQEAEKFLAKNINK